VAVFLLVATLAAGPAAAEPLAPVDSSRCLACHGMRNLAVRESIATAPHDFSVSPAFLASVHGRLACDQCHGDVGPYPHPPQSRSKRVTCAQDCHARDRDGRVYTHGAAVADFEASVHASGRHGDAKDRPTCLTCHGNGDPHAIEATKNLSRTARLALCDDCQSSNERCHRRASNIRRVEESMQETRYGLQVTLPLPYDQAVARATDALKSQGFGVLTTIDVQQTLKAKLDRDFRKYVILGACNPPLADRALHAELEVGLLLPCNVIVYETSPSSSVVAAMAPLAALGVVGENAALAEVAHEADRRLRQALASLESTMAT
jgi:uncharacterized protein (DUF302 family)